MHNLYLDIMLTLFLHLAVITPSLQIVQSPNSNIFSGMPLNLTCRIHFNDIVGVAPTVTVRWGRDGLGLVSNDQIALEESVQQVSPAIYEHHLFFSSIGFAAYGNYSCNSSIVVSVQDFRSEVLGGPAYFTVAIESEFISW